MSDGYRDESPVLELCRRECGISKSVYEMDPESIFFSRKAGATPSFSLRIDLDTPLCQECRDRGDATMEPRENQG
ncbi:MAG: hypothetical protein O7H41_14380 [Planctomycetota bacterium]|nr:hypothetical protein [Planctomycetota bacterium]